LAQIDDATLTLVSRFVVELGEFLNRTEAKVKGELSVLGESIVDNAIAGVDSALGSLEQAITSAMERAVE
jgi:hypothetical protein